MGGDPRKLRWEWEVRRGHSRGHREAGYHGGFWSSVRWEISGKAVSELSKLRARRLGYWSIDS